MVFAIRKGDTFAIHTNESNIMSSTRRVPDGMMSDTSTIFPAPRLTDVVGVERIVAPFAYVGVHQ